MSYDAREISDYAAAPVELYKFYHNTESWLFTSSAKDESYLGETYYTSSIKPPAVDQTGESRKIPIKIIMPASEALVALFRIVPPNGTTWLNIFRGHRNESTGELDPADTVSYWTGRVRGINLMGAEAEVICDPMEAMLDRPVLRVKYQKHCNNALYDEFCLIDRAAYACAATVVGISGNVITLDGSAFTGKAAGWFTAGEIYFEGDRREVKSHTTTAATVLLPFENLVVGDLVTVFPGCDKLPRTCRAKYNNILNYVAFPNIPQTNVFQHGVPPAVP